MKLRALGWLCLAHVLSGLLHADSPGIHTNRKSPMLLPLPKGDDVFHFVVFGDRTGGPAEGIKVLAQAVQDANLLDPDLVMTVGDLVNGYNQTPAWLGQMKEFRDTMNGLSMPWFPVAGNHDIYWRRDANNPEAKPPREHEEDYEKHFGPLWYWFEHKKTGFLVLFSDEGHPDGRVRDFSDPEQQRISRTQQEWIASALNEMRHLRHVFVFLHHPYWWSGRYPHSNWDEVHKLLAAQGNVRAVLAGHIHQMRYDGIRDGIGYYALATTGGSLSAGIEYPYFGLLHHFNVVTVRDDGYSMATIPVGSVLDPKQFTPERMKEVDAARYTLHRFVSPPLLVQPDGSSMAVSQVAITNPCTLPIDITLLARPNESWRVVPEHRHATLAPGAGRVFDFAWVREGDGTLDNLQPPEVELQFDVLAPTARLTMPRWSLPARMLLARRTAGPAHRTNGCLVLDGQSACVRMEKDDFTLADGPFTVEAWVRPEGKKNGAIVANLGVGGFILETDIEGAPRFGVQTDDRSVDRRFTNRLKSPIHATATNALPTDRWSHLAGVYDGARISLFVNGRRVGSTPATQARAESDKALFIGARPNPSWNVHNFSHPTAFWQGAVDAVRISPGARYDGDFTPVTELTHDASTAYSLSHDQRFGPFLPVTAPAYFQALLQGAAKVTPVVP